LNLVQIYVSLRKLVLTQNHEQGERKYTRSALAVRINMVCGDC